MGGERDMKTAETILKKIAPTNLAWLTGVRLRTQRRVLWLRSLWSNDLLAGEQNLAISHTEVDRILTDPKVMAEAETDFYQNDSTTLQISQQIQTADYWAAKDQAWMQLRQAFGLSDIESDLLAIAIAPEIDPSLRRVYGYLHDDATICYPTPWLAATLFQWNLGENISSDSQLVYWKLAHPAEGNTQPWSMTAAWVADSYIVSWLLQGTGLDPVLGTAVKWIAAKTTTNQTCLYPLQMAQMQEFVQAIHQNYLSEYTKTLSIEIELIAPSGAGKQTLAIQFCASLGLDLITVDASLLLSTEVSLTVAAERLMRVIRLAKLSDAVIYWYNLENVNAKAWRIIQEFCSLTIFGAMGYAAPGANAPLERRNSQAIRKVVHLPALTRSQRLELWQQLSAGSPAPEPILNWVLTPGEIAEAARLAPVGTEAVVEVCRQILHRGPGELFTPLVCPYTWNDIVLSPTVRQHLGELEEQARSRWQVYEEWGFERLFPMGRGMTAMFAGPSGTGKTMATQVLARSLGMELYRVDLSGVVNKYIGETEKRLKQVFDNCERANVLLFFDEADALFGQRTQVKDAHDRFANIEIDYLLQRMEQFDGIAILATNRKGDLDKAFLRRIRFIIDFAQPGPAERLTLWKLALLERTPAGEELLDQIDWQFLANRLNMTGADIKAAALGAAFLARSQGTRITMQHILHAAQREMIKHGVVLRPGDWER